MTQKTFSRDEIHNKFLIIGAPLKKLPRYNRFFEGGFYDLDCYVLLPRNFYVKFYVDRINLKKICEGKLNRLPIVYTGINDNYPHSEKTILRSVTSPLTLETVTESLRDQILSDGESYKYFVFPFANKIIKPSR